MRFFGWHLDFIGFSASFACAMHCMALPIILSLGLFGGTSWLENELVEVVLIVGSIFIAAYSIGRSYFKNHRDLVPVYTVGLGVLFLLLSLVLQSEARHFITALGGLAIAFAHYQNWKRLSCALPVRS